MVLIPNFESLPQKVCDLFCSSEGGGIFSQEEKNMIFSIMTEAEIVNHLRNRNKTIIKYIQHITTYVLNEEMLNIYDPEGTPELHYFIAEGILDGNSGTLVSTPSNNKIFNIFLGRHPDTTLSQSEIDLRDDLYSFINTELIPDSMKRRVIVRTV